jgi:hypothetical protein
MQLDRPARTNFRNGSKADLTNPKSDFRFTPDNRHAATGAPCPKGAH